jgi:arylsulfatase A
MVPFQLSRRQFLQSACASMALAASPTWSTSKVRRANIVLILADDMGYGDPHCFNSASKISTPHIDALAQNGMRFTDAHSGCAVCTPTRYGLLTGRYAWRSRLKQGVLYGYSPALIEPGRPTIATLMKSAGYRTAAVGKWHVGLGWKTNDGSVLSDRNDETGKYIDYSKPILDGPLQHGFDYFFGIPASLDMVPYVYVENDRVVESPTTIIEGRKGLQLLRGGPCAPHFKHEEVLPTLTEKAVNWLKAQQEPFFLYLPLTAPHTPVLPANEFKGRSTYGPYGDFVSQVDSAIGRIVETLRQRGLLENTLIVFTSDNGSPQFPGGGHMPNYIWRGRKSDIFEGGHRMPFIAHWPDHIKKGSTCDMPVMLGDLSATFAGLLRLTMPPSGFEDSVDASPLLLGRSGYPSDRAIIHHSGNGLFALRQGDWKYIDGKGSGGWTKGGEDDPNPGQLYNLREDPVESKNLYAQYPQRVVVMQALLKRIQGQE